MNGGNVTDREYAALFLGFFLGLVTVLCLVGLWNILTAMAAAL